MRTNDFLFEIKPGHFLILPGRAGGSQEESMAGVAMHGVGLPVKRIAQKDGSRLSVIASPRLTPREIVIRMGSAFPDRAPIWIETIITKDELGHRLWERQDITPATHSFYAFRLQRFLNGSRFCLVIAKEGGNTFYNAGVLSNKVPEDGMGVFSENDEDVQIPLGATVNWKPEIIDHFSRIRLCPTCLCVSDHGADKSLPWLGWGSGMDNLKRIREGQVSSRKAGGVIKLRDFEKEAEEMMRRRAARKLKEGARPSRDPVTGEYPAYVPRSGKRGRPKKGESPFS